MLINWSDLVHGSDTVSGETSQTFPTKRRSSIQSTNLRQRFERVKIRCNINIDEDGIRTHAGRAQWISSPSP